MHYLNWLFEPQRFENSNETFLWILNNVTCRVDMESIKDK